MSTDVIIESSSKGQIYVLLQEQPKRVRLCECIKIIFTRIHTYVVRFIFILPSSVSSIATFESRLARLLDVEPPELTLQACINLLAM